VIVFVHGESYEWNSGNPYDGSVLASYGQVYSYNIYIAQWEPENNGIGRRL